MNQPPKAEIGHYMELLEWIKLASAGKLPLHTLQKLRDVGLCPLPLGPDKHPSIPWKRFQTELPKDSDINKWTRSGRDEIPFCFSTGPNSRHEAFDFDHEADQTFHPFFVATEHIIGNCPIVKTRKGYHIHIRTDDVCRGMVLARTADNQIRIETRGTGNIIVAPPGLNGNYKLINGDFLNMPTITPEQRAFLWSTARSFNAGKDDLKEEAQRRAAAATRPAYVSSALDQSTPWDDFKIRGSWFDILKGWHCMDSLGLEWSRPGVNHKSATVKPSSDGVDVLTVHSQSAPLPAGKYNKFQAYKKLNHNDDGKAAAAALRRAGYGR